MQTSFQVQLRRYPCLFPFAFSPRAVNWRVAEQLSAHAISRSPEACCGGLAPMEASERSLVAELPFLPALAVSPPSFPSALVLFCANQSERLRVKFDGLHAALQRSADQSPGFTSGDQVEKPFFLFRRPAYPRHYAVTSSPSARARPGGGWLPSAQYRWPRPRPPLDQSKAEAFET